MFNEMGTKLYISGLFEDVYSALMFTRVIAIKRSDQNNVWRGFGVLHESPLDYITG